MAKKRPKKLGFLGTLVSVLIILGLGALLGLRLFSSVFGAPILGLQVIQTETRSAADGLLLGTEGLDELHVLHFVSKLVFPYDFFEDGADLQALRRSVAGQSSDSGNLGLTPAEWRSYEAFNLARQTGFDPASPGSPFLVMTLVFEFGYRLTTPESPIAVTVLENRTSILLKEPDLLRLTLEDPQRDRYPYPDAAVSAANWRRISDFVLGRAETAILSDELAEARSAAFQEASAFFLKSAVAAGLENPQIFRVP